MPTLPFYGKEKENRRSGIFRWGGKEEKARRFLEEEKKRRNS